VIVRPSLLNGADGYGARWFRQVARWPVHFIPASAHGRVAPLDVDDLGIALAALCEIDNLPSREIELGGAALMSIREYLALLRVEQCGGDVRPALTITIPHWLARIGSHICDALHVTPFSFGHLQLMQHDNVPRINGLAELLDGRQLSWEKREKDKRREQH
jgi:hypothetical protein